MNKHELKYIFFVSLLLSISFPPFPLGFLVPFALAIFIGFIIDKSPRDSFRLGYWLGLFWGAMTLFWISASTLVGAVFAITINALHYAVLWWLFAHFRKKSKTFALVSLPFLWTGFEFLRLFTDIRFNWMTLAYTQTYYRPFIQIVEVTGYLGLSFVLVLFSVLIYLAFRMKNRWSLAPLTGIVLITISMLFYGHTRIRHFENREYPLIRAGLVQPNVDPFEKWDPEFQKDAFDMLMKASSDMLPLKPQLIVWPETATPFYLRGRVEQQGEIHNFVDSTRTCLLTGTPDYQFEKSDDDYRIYNAAFFFRPGSEAFETYYKMALVPAAESMPFKSALPFLRKLDVGGGDFFPGHKFSVFKFQIPTRMGQYADNNYQTVSLDSLRKSDVNLSAIICYESVFPNIVRNFIARGANLLTIITNDGWFGLTSGPYQHSQYAVLRAVENRVSIIRCANTGISSFIDPTGRVLLKAHLETRKDLVDYLPLNTEHTFYTRHGEWFGKIILLVCSLLILFNLFGWKLIRRQKG